MKRKTMKPDRITNYEPIGNPTAEMIWHATGPLDKLAHEMELKWGAGRLPTLVSEDTAIKFGSAKAKLDAAIEADDVEEVRKRVDVMKRGWSKLDAEAARIGSKPLSALSPDVWTTVSGDGEIVALARSREDAEALLAEGTALRIYTLDEIMRIIASFEDGLLKHAKNEFPGAEVTNIRDTFDWSRGDEVEF